MLEPRVNETASAVLASQAMKELGFREEDIIKVTAMIMATAVTLDTLGIMNQSARDDYCTQIIADADLSSLGAPPNQYQDRALCLLKELKGRGKLTAKERQEFFAYQEAFLRNHHFYTEEAKKLFCHKEENIILSRKLSLQPPL